MKSTSLLTLQRTKTKKSSNNTIPRSLQNNNKLSRTNRKPKSSTKKMQSKKWPISSLKCKHKLTTSFRLPLKSNLRRLNELFNFKRSNTNTKSCRKSKKSLNWPCLRRHSRKRSNRLQRSLNQKKTRGASMSLSLRKSESRPKQMHVSNTKSK